MDPTLFGDVSAGMLRFLGIWYNEWGAFLGFLLALVSTFVIFLDSTRQSISALWCKVAAMMGTLLVLSSFVLRVSPNLGNRIASALVPLAIIGVIGALIAFLALITYLAWGRRAEMAQAVYVESTAGMVGATEGYGPSFTPPSTPAYTPAPPPISVPQASAPAAPATIQVGTGSSMGPAPAGATQILKRPPKGIGLLIVRGGPRTGQAFSLLEETNIGRDAQRNQISLDDLLMSRENSRIKLENGVFVIYDLASTNGTFVNGQKILKQPLKDHDEIKIGETSFAFVEVQTGEIRGSLPLPSTMMDNVHFSVSSPPTVVAGASFLVEVWAHLAMQRSAVLRRVRASAGSGDVLLHSRGPVKVARGTVLTVQMAVEGLLLDDAQDTIFWEGEIGNAQFRAHVPEDALSGSRQGMARVYIDGLQIARIYFAIEIGDTLTAPDELSARVERHRRAFASYASNDRDGVLARVQGMQKVMPHLDIFLDVLSLRSGQDWEHELTTVIPASDVFYLFWSEHARRSTWVEKEWRCALSTRGLDFIDPVPLSPPDVAPPPPELAGKHFNDWVLAFMRGQRAST